MQSTHAPRGSTGFTLVEIALVLVIIGLLLGGILKGQEMIVQAKIKHTLADMNGVLAAYNGYLDRYRALPGDDAGAGGPTGRWASLVAANNGNGDGTIGGAYESQTPEAESRLFWLHLRQAGFISGQGQEQPMNAHNGILGVQTGGGEATPGSTLGPVSPIGGLMACASRVPDKVAIAVDIQSDDGLSNSGHLRALNASANRTIANDQPPAASYQETGVTTYVICRAF
jgi:type II secretory pathway pseudopilin PulG